MKKFIITSLVLLAGLTGCKEDASLIRVVATQVPHAEILEEARDLIEDEGYKLRIDVIDNYALGNPAVANGSADANYFQHVPYFDQYNSSVEEKDRLVNVGGIHIEPIGLYSGTRKDITELYAGDKIIISDNASDYGRIVQFLAKIGLVTTVEGFNPTDPISHPGEAIASKSVNFVFQIINANLLVTARSNNEGALFFINGNYALSGGLGIKDTLISEPTENNPYVNIVAVRNGRENEKKIKTLVRVLQSQTIRNFINQRYNGSVIPA